MPQWSVDIVGKVVSADISLSREMETGRDSQTFSNNRHCIRHFRPLVVHTFVRMCIPACAEINWRFRKFSVRVSTNSTQSVLDYT